MKRLCLALAVGELAQRRLGRVGEARAAGLLSAVAILTSHAYGAKNPEQAGQALRNGLLASIAFGLLVAIAAGKLFGYEGNVIVIADGGWKYLSTGAWTDDLDQVEERAKGIIYF